MTTVERNTLHRGDCLQVLNGVDDNSVDMVCVDLPYGEIDCAWDNKIDLAKLWTHLKRVGKPNCNYIFFCSTRFGCDLINSNPNWYAYDIVWEKTQPVGFLNSRVCPLRAHEMIYVFKKKNKPKGYKSTYNPQKTEGTPYNRIFPDGHSIIKKNHSLEQVYCQRKDFKRKNNINDGWRYPTSIWKCKKERVTGHATEKPLELCERLIKTYSNPKDLVLDCCMGSGTTCLASFNTNRDYIGIELDEKWFNYSVDRLKNATTPTINNNENVIINNDDLVNIVDLVVIEDEEEED